MFMGFLTEKKKKNTKCLIPNVLARTKGNKKEEPDFSKGLVGS